MNYTDLSSSINVYGLVSAFVYTFQKGFHYDGERHPGWEFVFVDSGKIIADADDKKYIIKSGELICHKPMEYHNLNPYNTDATAIIFCFYCDSCKMSRFENKIFTLNQQQRSYLYTLAAKSQSFLEFKDPLTIAKDGYMEKRSLATAEDEQYIKNIIELLILSLFSAKSTQVPERANVYTNLIKRTLLTENIKNYLQDNIGSPISIADIAKEFSYSPSTVKTVFKNETGFGIIEYYNKLRLDIAKKMLSEKKYTVCQISDFLGFNDTSHFINFFKSRTDITPKKYN